MKDTDEAGTDFSLPEEAEIRDLVTAHTCLRRCLGHRGVAAGCCRVGTRDYIMGPIPDTEALLARLRAKFGREIAWDEVFIDFEEGSALFPDKPCWQRRDCFPALRLVMDDERLPCVFLGDDDLCRIHDIRSVTCRNYLCDHLRGVLDQL